MNEMINYYKEKVNQNQNLSESILRRLNESEHYLFEGSELNQTGEWDNIIKKTLLDLIISNYPNYSKSPFQIHRGVRDYNPFIMPDFFLKYNAQTVFLGEEKSSEKDLDEAKKDLIKKSNKIPKEGEDFLFCYGTGGNILEFYILDFNNEALHPISDKFDLRSFEERKKAAQVVWNIFQIIFSAKSGNDLGKIIQLQN